MAPTSEPETTAYEACARSGAFALLIALALASLIPVWSQRKASMILGRYLALRLNLAAALDALDENPLWREYERTHETESVPIKQLVSIRVNSTTLAPFNDASPAQANLPPTKPDIPPSATKPGVAPPTGLGFVVGFGEVRQIADFLTQLNDSDLLTRSRNASDFFNFSIYRWIIKRDNLIAQNRRAGGAGTTLNAEPDPQSSANFTPAQDKDDLLALTLGGVRELAKAELPPISNTVKLGQNEPEVELTTSSLRLSLYAASLFAQVLMLFVIVYFWAFTREAISAASFPSKGTLFGALAGSRPTLVIFFLALWIPLAASVGVLLASYGATSRWGTLWLAVCSLLICWAVVSVFTLLKSKSYFRPLFKRSTLAN